MDRYMQLATQALLNQHDICRPLLLPLAPACIRPLSCPAIVPPFPSATASAVQQLSGSNEGSGPNKGKRPRAPAPAAVSRPPSSAVPPASSCPPRGGSSHNSSRRRGKGSVAPAGQSEEAGTAALLAPLVEAVGEGLFPSVARLNHSCAPNCALSIDAYGCCIVRVRGRR